MKAFDELRARAREQMDSAIAAARNQYKQTLAQIATLEDVIVKDKDKTRSLKLRTEPPSNGTTLREAMEAMEAVK
jgi:hypothetical protein